MDKEEGEMSDENAMIIDEIKKEPVPEDNAHQTVLFRADKNGIVIQRLEKVDAAKLEERAKRFGLNLSSNRLVTQNQIDELYAKSGIKDRNERHFRFDTLHLNGIDGLTTREIFEYLEDYKPVSLEKIDDVSCNIVCQDHISAALALLVHSREIVNEHIKEMLSEKSKYHWREGMPHPRKDLILMRFATNGDKKMPKNKPSDERSLPNEYDDDQCMDISKNPWGDLCKSWGVYDHQEVFTRRLPKHDFEDDVEEPIERVQMRNKRLAMRLGKRRQVEQSEDSDSDSDWKKKSKTPRMRMHADDEESKQKKKPEKGYSSDEEDTYPDKEKNTYVPLSIEVVNTNSEYIPRQTSKLSDKFKSHSKNNTNVQSRLGVRVTPLEECATDDGPTDGPRHVPSRVQKVKSAARSTASVAARSTASVWSRLDSTTSKNQSDQSSRNDLRQILKSRKDKRPDDLRERISKSKKTNLRIEIDNI